MSLSLDCLLITGISMPASGQNAQQAVEKYLKAVIVERGMEFRRTHSILELLGILTPQGITLSVSEDEMDLMGSIYIPSKYPVYSARPQTVKLKSLQRPISKPIIHL